MDREQERSDKRGETITLVGSLSQRENSANKQGNTDDREHDRRPTEVSPKPKPVAFRMQGSRVAGRRITKNCEEQFEIANKDPAQVRITHDPKRVVENSPREC